MRETATAREEGPGNPSMDDEDEFENLGNATGITCVKGVDHANVKEVDFGKKCFSLSHPCMVMLNHIRVLRRD